jgi:MoaA/NifB/PqqE/SkfB family radical SAM enzyme
VTGAEPYPLEGVVSWNMNTTCNYRCTYCTQRFLDDRTRWAKDVPAFVAGFARLPGDWEIKLSGGEPFLHPHFLDLVAALVDQGRRVSVVTNLSARDDVLARFATLTAARPGIISASLHLEYIDPDPFRAKVERLARVHAGRICVTCVATRANLPRLEALRAAFAPIPFKVQPEKEDREVIGYTESELAHLDVLGGHNGTGEVAPDYSGRPCWAGARYFIVDHRGDVYRCYPARKERAEQLGNLLDGSFRPRFSAEPCRYRYCNCTVPRERGMVRGGPRCSPVA